ncbi:MAG: homoserine kinase [Anaerolineae bacterium]|nr:homoserine kinase [Anaerolineae bacterium]MCI0610732.1 homoserine kinase [Anaerolineae bacterium]
MIKIRVPATSANLGPGFDSLGLALDIWNEVKFEEADEMTYQVTGEGAEKLNQKPKNLLTNSFKRVYEICDKPMRGVNIQAYNNIPHSSGLGSSAAAIVAGIYGANELLTKPLDTNALVKLAAEIEGHPDNVAPALLGGLVVSTITESEVITRRYEIPELTILVVKPEVQWQTHTARSVLPNTVSRADAIFNIGRTALVIDALRNGDLDLLQKVMDDRIHQSYRLKHIPAGVAVYETAKQFGAAALSGAGPSIICFVSAENAEKAKEKLIDVFTKQGIPSRGLITQPSSLGGHKL